MRLAGQRADAGDWLSIDGRTGNIFLGRIPTLAQPALRRRPDAERCTTRAEAGRHEQSRKSERFSPLSDASLW